MKAGSKTREKSLPQSQRISARREACFARLTFSPMPRISTPRQAPPQLQPPRNTLGARFSRMPTTGKPPRNLRQDTRPKRARPLETRQIWIFLSNSSFLYGIVKPYASEIASAGQTPAQVPQLMHVPASISRFEPFSEIALTGHSPSHAPQFTQASEIV